MELNVLAAVAMIIAALTVVSYGSSRLSRAHGGDVRVVWYLFSLSLVVTALLGWWAVDVGAISEHGKYQGELGDTLKRALGFMLDLDMDIKVLASIVAIIVLPQLLGYFLSGLAGCASAPLLVEQSLGFFVWGLVKSFSVCSGIIFALALIGLSNGWMTFLSRDLIALSLVSGMLMAMSFIVLLEYRETESMLVGLCGRYPKLCSKCAKLHAWFTRCTAISVEKCGSQAPN